MFHQTKNKDLKTKAEKRPSFKKRTHHGVVDQKNCLQLLLNRYFDGDVVSEKSFRWLKTPVQAKEDPAYQPIMDALIRYRGHQKIGKPGRRLRCDFVCESRKTFHFHALYHRAPLGFKMLDDFTKNRHAVIELINKAQKHFNEVIVRESLALPQYTFIPHESF